MAYGTGFSYGKTGTALPKKEKLRKSDNQSFGHLGMFASERGRSSGARKIRGFRRADHRFHLADE
jgi:hypothetical protein